MEDAPALGWRYEWDHRPDTTHESETDKRLIPGRATLEVHCGELRMWESMLY